MIPVSRLTYEWLCAIYGEQIARLFLHPVRIA